MATARQPQHQQAAPLHRHTLFIAAPMSGLASDDQYRNVRQQALVASNRLQHLGAIEVYFAGQDIDSTEQFSGQLAGLRTDIAALRRAHGFVMLFPERVASSVLIEAGYAMALDLPMLLLVRDRNDLPYMFQEAEQARDCVGIPPISIQEYNTDNDLETALETWVRETFGKKG